MCFQVTWCNSVLKTPHYRIWTSEEIVKLGNFWPAFLVSLWLLCYCWCSSRALQVDQSGGISWSLSGTAEQFQAPEGTPGVGSSQQWASLLFLQGAAITSEQQADSYSKESSRAGCQKAFISRRQGSCLIRQKSVGFISTMIPGALNQKNLQRFITDNNLVLNPSSMEVYN